MTKNEIRSKINLDQRWLERAVMAIDARQTADEKVSDQTIHDNDRGWNAADASYGGYLAGWIRRSRKPLGQRLSGRFVAEAKAMMQKYCGQLGRIIEEKALEALAA